MEGFESLSQVRFVGGNPLLPDIGRVRPAQMKATLLTTSPSVTARGPLPRALRSATSHSTTLPGTTPVPRLL